MCAAAAGSTPSRTGSCAPRRTRTGGCVPRLLAALRPELAPARREEQELADVCRGCWQHSVPNWLLRAEKNKNWRMCAAAAGSTPSRTGSCAPRRTRTGGCVPRLLAALRPELAPARREEQELADVCR